MSTEVEIPQEVREQINQKLHEYGVIEEIEGQVKEAMKTARNEIKEKKEESELLQFPLKKTDELEHEAFNAVIKYLESRGLKFTLSTLMEECGEKMPEKNEALDVLEYLTAVDPTPEEDEAEAGGEEDDGIYVAK